MENVNDGIRSPEVRAVFPDGTVEVMPTAVAVRRARAMGLDLVLVAPTAIPPIAKAIDYRQWLYENNKNHRGDV
jgi:translation initiation factor IF-3